MALFWPKGQASETKLENLRFLACYRRDWLFDKNLLVGIREADLYGASLGEAFRAFPHHREWRVRAAVLRLLWCQHFATDLSVPLSEPHELRRGPATVTGAARRDLPRLVDERGQGLDVVGEPAPRVWEHRTGGRVNDSAVLVGVGTRLKYDGEVVVVEEMFGSSAGNEFLVRDGPGRRFRLSLREALASGRASVIAEGPGPASGDDRETASVILAQLSDEELEATLGSGRYDSDRL